MIMLDHLKDWLISWADSPLGPAMLGVLSAAEAVTFPLPPDPLLVALAVRNPDMALLLATVTTAGSVIGGLLGHWLGLRFGRPLLKRFNSRHVEKVEALFVRHGFLALFLASLTPIPYKLFTISAGVFGISRLRFILACTIGRGLRFFSLAILILIWGENIQNLLVRRMDIILATMGAILLTMLLIWGAWTRRKTLRKKRT